MKQSEGTQITTSKAPPSTRPKPRRRKGALLKAPSCRTAEGRRLREFRASLVAHVGGKPSATQEALIDRATMLTLHVTRMDTKAIETGEFSDHGAKQYLAWSNSLNRTLALLGLKGAPSPTLTVAQRLAARESQR